MAVSPPFVYVSSIFSTSLSGTSFCHRCSRIIELRTKGKDPAIRLYSSNFLPNKYKAPVYIYTNKGRNLERRRAKWQFVLEGFLSMDAHYCSLRNFEYAIPIPPLFFVLSSTCQFLSLLIFPLLIYPLVRSLPEFSRGSLKDNRSNRLIRKLSFPRLSPFISPINERLEGFRNFFFLLRAFYYLSDFPNFLNFLRKKLFSIPRSIIATLFDQISDDVRIHGCIRKMFIWKPRLSDGVVGRGFDWRISSIGRHKVNYWIQDQSRVSKTDARSKSYPSHAAPPLTCFRQRWSSVGPFKLFSPRYSTSRHRVSRAWTRTSIDRSIFSSIAAIVDALRERTPRRHSAYPPAPRNGGFPFHPMLFRLVMSGCCCCWVRPCPRLRTRAEPFRDRYRDVFNGEIGFRSRLRGFRTRPRAIVDERLSFSVPVDLSVLRRVCLRGNNRESCEG